MPTLRHSRYVAPELFLLFDYARFHCQKLFCALYKEACVAFIKPSDVIRTYTDTVLIRLCTHSNALHDYRRGNKSVPAT